MNRLPVRSYDQKSWLKWQPGFVAAIILLSLVMMSCRLGGMLPEAPPAASQAEASQPAPTAADGLAAEPPTELAPTALPPVTENPAPASEPTQAAPQEQSSQPSAEPPACTETTCYYPGSFLLGRPVGSTGRNIIDVSNRFGEYKKGTKEANHGVDFLNSTGIPVVAAADGVVEVAGDDTDTSYGLRPGAYGNLVILKHALPGYTDPIYTLYAHLSQVDVKPGDVVQAGQQIGLVGSTGSVKGSTLYFEVRMGENAYKAVRNPDLWLTTLTNEDGQQLGALAGRIIDKKGNYIPVNNVVVERLAGPGMPAQSTVYLRTYADKRFMGQQPWQESFAVGDMPPGQYQITFMYNGVHQQVVDVKPGQLTSTTFTLP